MSREEDSDPRPQPGDLLREVMPGDDWYSVASFLRTAADRYDGLEKQCLDEYEELAALEAGGGKPGLVLPAGAKQAAFMMADCARRSRAYADRITAWLDSHDVEEQQ